VSGATLGWDVGGANVKAARVGEGGFRFADIAVVERAFPLWRDPARLPAVLVEIAAALGDARAMAVTMTAELADCFASKREGVAFVLDAFRTAFPDVDPVVYGIDGRFRSVDDARARPYVVAAANWMASASVVAEIVGDALLIDVGSTTTDIIPIVGGRVVARGRTDTARLRSGELVYTGALRTPVSAIVRSVPYRGRRCRVAAEYFAIAADAYVWLEQLAIEDYTCDTPDGRGRSRADAGARLARMICADAAKLSAGEITAIAEQVARAQAKQIASGIRQVKRRLGDACPRVALLAGQGRALARAAADAGDFVARDLAEDIGVPAARSTPAAAVAYLLVARMSTPV
jgi:hypothetical protein